MIILTFEEYDNLMEKAENMDVPEDYDYPTVEKIKEMLISDESYLLTALALSLYPESDQYYEELNSLLKDIIYLTNDEKEKRKPPKEYNGKIVLSIAELNQISEIVKEMSFQYSGWYPTVYDFKTHELQAKREDIAFLLWLINTSAELNPEEAVAKEYAQKILKEKLTIL